MFLIYSKSTTNGPISDPKTEDNLSELQKVMNRLSVTKTDSTDEPNNNSQPSSQAKKVRLWCDVKWCDIRWCMIWYDVWYDYMVWHVIWLMMYVIWCESLYTLYIVFNSRQICHFCYTRSNSFLKVAKSFVFPMTVIHVVAKISSS